MIVEFKKSKNCQITRASQGSSNGIRQLLCQMPQRWLSHIKCNFQNGMSQKSDSQAIRMLYQQFSLILGWYEKISKPLLQQVNNIVNYLKSR